MRLSRRQVASASHSIPEVRFEDQELTSFGGLVILQALAQAIDLRSRLRAVVRHLPSRRAYCPSRILLLLIVHLFLGFRRLRDLEYYRSDEFVKRMLGLDRLPDVSTLSRRLADFDERSVEHLAGFLRDLVAKRAISASPRRLTFDFDGSVISTKARSIEGSAIGYNTKKKGARSYYPLFAVVAQLGSPYAVLHRSGNVHDSHGALEFMRECHDHLRNAGFGGILEIRIDGAHYSDETCSALHEAGIEFSVSVPSERIPKLRDMVHERQDWRRIDDEWSCFPILWRPKATSKRVFRCFVYRRLVAKPRKGPIQLDFFTPVDRAYEYKVVMTNKKTSAAALLRFHNGRGSQEATFAEAKSDLSMGYLPSRRQNGNRVYLLCNLIALALGREIQMRAAPPRHVRNTATRACLWLVERMGTIRRRIIQRAARLNRPQGRQVLTFGKGDRLEHDLCHFLQAAKAA